jgi:hypothetical protein
MGEKERKQRDNPEQSRRFEEKARELGADESGKAFKRAFESVAKKAPKPKRASSS